eukprot:5442306-Prymnesium_polylepis.1
MLMSTNADAKQVAAIGAHRGTAFESEKCKRSARGTTPAMALSRVAAMRSSGLSSPTATCVRDTCASVIQM